jgi:hypothetical protein
MPCNPGLVCSVVGMTNNKPYGQAGALVALNDQLAACDAVPPLPSCSEIALQPLGQAQLCPEGFVCDAGVADCDRNPANGCETDLTATVAHCGMCGRACATGANATGACASAMCTSTCNPGFADCDGNAANGCESTPGGDPNNWPARPPPPPPVDTNAQLTPAKQRKELSGTAS